jgi:protein TonB
MAVGDGILEKVGNDPVQTGSMLSLLPSLLIHGTVVLVIWLGLFESEQVQPPVTFISLAPAAVAPPEAAPPAPSVAAPDLEPEFEPLPLPATGMTLPQPAPPAAPAEPFVDFMPPDLPARESFPFDPTATRAAEPEPEDAIPIKAAEKPKPKVPEPPKQAQKQPERPKKKKEKETKKSPAPAVAPSKATAAAPAAATVSSPTGSAKASPSTSPQPTSPQPAPAARQTAAISDAPIKVTNPRYAGACPISYPERARRRNQEGTVVIHALIGTDGKPIEVSVAQSSGHRLLDEAAEEAIADCAFVPQKVGGRAVKAIVEIPIPFKLI